MTDHALGQLCSKLEIGTGYIRKCLPFPELVNYNLNKWISYKKDRDLMVRCNETKVRAVLSNQYKRLDNDLVAHHTLDKLMDMGAEIKESHYDGDYLKLTAVTPKLKGEVKKDFTKSIVNLIDGYSFYLDQPIGNYQHIKFKFLFINDIYLRVYDDLDNLINEEIYL